MNRLFAFLLLAALAVPTFAQAPHIPPNATVYIEPMDGYETDLAAAMTKKQVPIILVADKNKAQYIIRSNVRQTKPNPPAIVVNNSNTNASNGSNAAWDRGAQQGAAMAAQSAANRVLTVASVSVTDAQTSTIVFAYSTDKGGIKATAEACAKHLKEFIEKPYPLQ